MAKVNKVERVTEAQLTLTEDEANALAILIGKSGYFSVTHGVYEALRKAGFEGAGYNVYMTGQYQVQRA